MSVTTGPLAVTHRRRRSITPRAIESTSIPCSIFKPSPASCRPTPIAGTTSSTIPRALRERLRRHCAGHTQGDSSLSWPISLPMHGAERTQRRSRRLRLAAVKRIDALFDIERDINGLSAEERLRVRQEQSAPLLAALEAWLREEHSRLSRSASVAQPIDYMLKRWDRFARFIEDGRVCLTNNAAERALRDLHSVASRGCSPAPNAAAASIGRSSPHSSKPAR